MFSCILNERWFIHYEYQESEESGRSRMWTVRRKWTVPQKVDGPSESGRSLGKWTVFWWKADGPGLIWTVSSLLDRPLSVILDRPLSILCTVHFRRPSTFNQDFPPLLGVWNVHFHPVGQSTFTSNQYQYRIINTYACKAKTLYWYVVQFPMLNKYLESVSLVSFP